MTAASSPPSPPLYVRDERSVPSATMLAVRGKQAGPRGHVFHRAVGRELSRADRAEGAWIIDTDGRRYLDAAGGAVVVGIGHGDVAVIDALAEQQRRVAYAHGTQF